MNSESPNTNGLETLIKAIGEKGPGGAPVHLWNPPYCGELDMVIQTDGRWDYNKTPIGREKLVKLFASVLKREGDDYYLVTPVEKIGIKVVDAPFIATEMEKIGEGSEQRLIFTTNVGDKVIAGKDHTLRFELAGDGETLKPYLHIRAGLEAKLSRSLYYEIASFIECEKQDDEDYFGVWSEGHFFPIDRTENCDPIERKL